MSEGLARAIDAIPYVATTALRNARYPAPDANFRVQNGETRAIERWNGAAWVTQGTEGPWTANVRDYGAVGNGVTDDSAAFQAAINAAALVRGAVVVPGGEYVWANTVTVTTGVSLVSLGDPPPNYWPNGFNGDFSNTGAVIRYTGSGVALDVVPPSNGLRRHCWIEGLTFVGGADTGQVAGTGIRFRSLEVTSAITPVVLRNVTCTRFPTAGIDLVGNVFEASAYNVQCNRNGTGFRARATATPGETSGEWALHRCTFAFNTVGLDLAGGGNWKLYGNSTSFNTNENAIFNGIKLAIFGHSQERGGAVGMRFQTIYGLMCEGLFINYDTATTQTGVSLENVLLSRFVGINSNPGASNVDFAIDSACHTITIDKYYTESGVPRISDSGTATEFNPRPLANYSDRGDVAVTLTWIDAPVQRFTTTLTAARTVTLPTTGLLMRGHRFRIVRTAGGAFGLDVGGVITLNAPSGACNWAEVMWSGSGWVLVGAGAL